MKQLTTIKPYSDDKLIWNDKTNQYELAFKFVKEEYPGNFQDDATLKRRIKKNSRVIYSFLNYRINNYNKRFVSKLLSNTQEGRNFMFALLSLQFEADVETGYNDIGSTPAINFANGQIMDRNQIWANLVTVDVEQEFDNSPSYFGLNIGVQTALPPNLYLFVGK